MTNLAGMMNTYMITGKVIEGDYIGAPLRSCEPVDMPDGERVFVTLDGITYERTVYRRYIWRAMAPWTTVCEFVIIDGKRYEVSNKNERKQ